MMDLQFENKLIESLSLLEQGEPLDDILARYPEDVALLRPLLETALALPAARIEPSDVAKTRSRRSFLAQAQTMRKPVAAPRFRLLRPLAVGFASLALAFIFLGGVVAASASALPSDPLYQVKRTVERTRISLAADNDREVLAREFEQERRDEIRALIAAGRAAMVEFSGRVESIQADTWLISGLPVRIDPATQIVGEPAIGRRVDVQGHTRDGQVLAGTIIVEPGDVPLAEPTASPSPTLRPTVTPTRTALPTATRTPMSSPAPSPTPRPTLALPPPSTPEPIDVDFTGVVEQIGAAQWRVGGALVEVNAATEVRDAIGIGDLVRVRAENLPGGRLVARRIDRVDDRDNDNANSNTSQNDNDNSGGGGNDNTNENGDDNGRDDNSGGGGNDNTNENGDDNSGSDSGDDNSGGEDDNSGSGGGDNSGGDDNSGSGGGDDNNVGSGSSGDDTSGSGGGDDNSSGDDTSGSGGGGDNGGDDNSGGDENGGSSGDEGE